MIEVRGLCKRFETSSGLVTALEDIELRVAAGERLGLFGPSGSGKSTLLRCIAGLEVPEKGAIRIGDVDVCDARSGIHLPPWRRPIGVVFQDFALWPHMTVLENVMFPVRHGRVVALTKAGQQQACLEALQMVRMSNLADRFPTQLSGGQRQRVAIARALVSRPSVLLMDEPLSSLDPHLRKRTRDELVDLLERVGITTIFVSHDYVDGVFMTHSVGVMREGRLVQRGSAVEVFTNPADASVAEALDAGVVVRCRRQVSIAGSGARYVLLESGQSLELPTAAQNAGADSECHMLIRRDACRLWTDGAGSPHLQRIDAKVIREGYTGRGWCILVSFAGTCMEVWEHKRPGLVHGDQVALAVDVQCVQILPDEHGRAAMSGVFRRNR